MKNANAALVCGVFLLLCGTAGAAGPPPAAPDPAGTREWGVPPEVRAREVFGNLIPEVFSGGVLIRADFSHIVVAMDEEDSEGHTDGRVDHLFLFETLQPLLPSFTLRDAVADIEYRPTGLRILSHTQKREIELLILGTPSAPRPKQSVYSFQASRAGIHLYAYSGKTVGQLTMEDVSARETDLLTRLQEKSALLDPGSSSDLGEFDPDPTDSPSSSSCKPSCSKSCLFGSCSAACIPGHCATCECLGDPPKIFPNCFCA